MINRKHFLFHFSFTAPSTPSSSHLCATHSSLFFLAQISFDSCLLFLVHYNRNTFSVVHHRDQVFFGFYFNFNGVHLRISLLVVCCIDQDFIKDLVESSNICCLSAEHSSRNSGTDNISLLISNSWLPFTLPVSFGLFEHLQDPFHGHWLKEQSPSQRLGPVSIFLKYERIISTRAHEYQDQAHGQLCKDCAQDTGYAPPAHARQPPACAPIIIQTRGAQRPRSCKHDPAEVGDWSLQTTLMNICSRGNGGDYLDDTASSPE